MFCVTVYIELVIFNNLAVDLLLEIATLMVFRRRVKWWRVLLGAVFGASVATVYPHCPDAVMIVIKVLLAPIMALMFDGVQCKKERKQKRDGKAIVDKSKLKNEARAYLKRLVVFCLLTYFVGGVVYGIDFAFHIDVASYWQFGVVSFALLTLLITVRIIVLRFSKNARKICPAKLFLSGHEIDVKALCDSGNELTDSLSGLPVVIISKTAEEELVLDANMIEGYVSVKTVSGESEMPIIRLEGVGVKGKKYSAYGALSKQDYDDFEIILQNTMF